MGIRITWERRSLCWDGAHKQVGQPPKYVSVDPTSMAHTDWWQAIIRHTDDYKAGLVFIDDNESVITIFS